MKTNTNTPKSKPKAVKVISGKKCPSCKSLKHSNVTATDKRHGAVYMSCKYCALRWKFLGGKSMTLIKRTVPKNKPALSDAAKKRIESIIGGKIK